MVITTIKWTIEQYHQLVNTGILHDRAVELLQGDLVEMAPEGMPHVVYCMETVKYLRSLLGARAEVREAHPITIPSDSEPEPDVAVVKAPSRQYLEHHPYPEDIFWLIEYADTTLIKDLNYKQQIYAAASIPEYWVVNLQVGELVVFRDPNIDGYQVNIKIRRGTISPIAFPDLHIEVQRLFS